MTFDLDILRGWKEQIAEDLQGPHLVPPLASLKGPRGLEFPIHGVDVYVGRFHPQHGPIDVQFEGLMDHELYRISAPHARICLEEDGLWKIRHLSPSAVTHLNGAPVLDTREWLEIKHGDTLRLGVVDFEFQLTGVNQEDWKKKQKSLLLAIDKASLFLMRAGSACGPHFTLDAAGKKILLGRSFPDVVLPEKNRRLKRPDWDLAGLRDDERKFVGFRHLELWCESDNWYINPLSARQRTYVNRVEISGLTPLMPGDELGLGSVLFHFHHPSNIRLLIDRRTVELPAILNWREERARRERGEAP